MAESGMTAPYSWQTFSAGLESAQGQASAQARTLARALAAHSVVFDKDAVALDLEDRLEAFWSTVWPANPLDGYGLHSSLGAFVVTKVAVGLVPSVRKGLRHEALKTKAILQALQKHGVAEPTALSMLGAFAEPEADFKANDAGLSTSVLAGLAERTLTRAERDRALSQVAYSARCLNRLASAAALLAAVRHLLPVLPPESFGHRFAVMTTALAFGRPERALELDDPEDQSGPIVALRELAQAEQALARGERPSLAVDDYLAVPSSAPPRAPRPHEADALLDGGNTDGAFQDAFFGGVERSEDVLDIVEERVDPESDRPAPLAAQAVPRPARFGDGPRLREDELLAFAQQRRAQTIGQGPVGVWLGLKLLRPAPTALSMPIPPDEALLSERPDAGLSALFPPVRAVLRAVVQSAEGRPPTAASLAAGGDLEWVLRRAEALALVVRGELDGAQRAGAGLPPGAAPEVRWAADRALRFSTREPEPVRPEEARPMAAVLVADLAHQLGRTLAGTLPGDAAE